MSDIEIRKSVDWGKLTGILSMVVALSALGASLWQGYLLQTHNRLSVTPALEFERNMYPSQGYFEVYINNNGVGPARAIKTEILLDGLPVEDWQPVFKALETDPECFGYGAITRLYRVGDRQMVVRSVEKDGCRFTREEAQALFSRVSIRMEYESLYHDKFQLSGEMLSADPLPKEIPPIGGNY